MQEKDPGWLVPQDVQNGVLSKNASQFAGRYHEAACCISL